MSKVTKTSLSVLVLSSLYVFTTAPAFAQEKAVTPVKAQKSERVVPLPSRVDMSIKPGNIRNIAETNVWSPLVQSRNHVKFLSFIGKKDTKDSNELNLGYGQRTLVNNSYILGYYGYYDVRRTSYDNVFNQITLGMEYLSDPLDIRLNGYAPINKYRGVSTAKVKTTSTSVTVDSADREYALGGWDLEVGTSYRFNKDNSVHVYAARFDFRSGHTKAIRGNRYRTEIRFNNLSKHLPYNSRFTWGWETQRDKVRGRVRYSMFRLSIPLYTPNHIPERISGLRSRMIDPIIRDVDIVAGLNTKTEQAYFADADGKASGQAKGFKKVGTGVELYNATTNGREGEIILVDRNITTSLEMKLQENQKVITTGQALKLVTPSGVQVNYVPQFGTPKTLTNTLPEGFAVMLNQGAEVKGLRVMKTVYNNPDDENAADYKGTTKVERQSIFAAMVPAVVLDENNANAYYQVKVDSINPGALTYTMSCLGRDSSGEPEEVTCTGISINAQGRVRITDNSFKSADSQVVVTDSQGLSTTIPLTLFSRSGLQTSRAAAEAVLKNDEQFGETGVRLLYADDFKCAGDADTFGGTCSTTGEKKIDEVKKTLGAYLDDNNPHTAKIKAALLRTKPTMVMFNNANQKGQFGAYNNWLGNAQDLQADESFVDAKDNGGANQAKTRRSAAVEEIIHMVHNYGITRAMPDWQERLDRATAEALVAGKLGNWNKEDLPRRDLDDEYFADGVEAYFNMRAGGGVTSRGTTSTNGLCGTVGANLGFGADTTCGSSSDIVGGRTSREMLKDNHRALYDLVDEIFGGSTSLY